MRRHSHLKQLDRYRGTLRVGTFSRNVHVKYSTFVFRESSNGQAPARVDVTTRVGSKYKDSGGIECQVHYVIIHAQYRRERYRFFADD